MHRSRRRKLSRGYTLVEAVGAVTLTALLVAVCMPVLAKLHHGKAAITQEVAWQLALQQLGESMREDAQQATTASIEKSDGRTQLLMSSGDGAQSIYELVNDEVRRTRKADRETIEGFLFPHETLANWSIQDVPDSTTRLAVLQLTIPSSRFKLQAAREIEVNVAVGAGSSQEDEE